MSLQVELQAINGRKITLFTGLFINTKFVLSSPGHKIASISPVDKNGITTVGRASETGVSDALKAARMVLVSDAWSGISGTQRGAFITKLADLIENNKITSVKSSRHSDITPPVRVCTPRNTLEIPVVDGFLDAWSCPHLRQHSASGTSRADANLQFMPNHAYYQGWISVWRDNIALIFHPDTDKISFKRSTVTGKASITLETGGKSPLLEKVLERYISRFAEIFAENKGPQQREIAKLVTGGRSCNCVGGDRGFFIKPSVFCNVEEHMKLFQEVIFGLFITIASFTTEADAIRIANNTPYGLGAAVFKRDIERAHRLAGRLELGMVWVNSSNDSGIGRELGEAGLAACIQTKACMST
ncbi:Aldehyde/histidinol dehydrogenase [Aspergillus floccosus]